MYLILIAVLIVLGCLALYVLHNKKNESDTELNAIVKEYLEENTCSNEVAVKITELPSLENKEDLVEITDKKLLAKIDHIIPGIANVAVNASAVHQAAGVLKDGGKIYQAILPPGVVLCKSKEIEGAVRGFGRNAKNINGQANFLPVDGVMKKTAAVNVANAAMNAASMVVGQYYMSQISSELDGISESVSQISDFQDAEYKSHVMVLLAQIHSMAEFSCESLENDEICKEEIAKIAIYEKECLELLGQANIMLGKIAGTNKVEYRDYEKKIKEADSWYKYQQVLMEVYQKIEGLKYALHRGLMSREQCYVLNSMYMNKVEQTKRDLIAWHTYNADKFGIDIASKKRTHQSMFDKAVYAIPSLFDEEYKYKTMQKNIVEMICFQTEEISRDKKNENDYFREPVTIVAKDQKVYFLSKK